MSKLDKLKQIVEGWKNVIWENPQVERVAKERASICANCDFNVDNICDSNKSGTTIHGNPVNGCGCPLIAKTRSMATSCPKMLWFPYDLENDKELMPIEDKEKIRQLFEERILNSEAFGAFTPEEKEKILKLLDEQHGDGI